MNILEFDPDNLLNRINWRKSTKWWALNVGEGYVARQDRLWKLNRESYVYDLKVCVKSLCLN